MSKERKNFKKPKVVGSHHSVDLTEPVIPLFHSRGSESFCFNFHCRPITKRMIASLRINLASCLEANSSNNAPKGRIQTWPVFPGRSHHLRLLGGQTITVPLDIVCSHIIDQHLPRSLHRMREKCIQQLSGLQPIHPDFLLLGLSRPHRRSERTSFGRTEDAHQYSVAEQPLLVGASTFPQPARYRMGTRTNRSYPSAPNHVTRPIRPGSTTPDSQVHPYF